METYLATNIGLGVESERKLIGLFWTMPSTKVVHHTLNCQRGNWDHSQAFKTPVYEEDGELYTENQYSNRIVRLCKSCSYETAPEDWKERAACRENFDERFFSEDKTERDAAINELCNQCPVIRDCLEYGVVRESENAGGVWGGIYFSPNRQERRKQIERQAKRLQ